MRSITVAAAAVFAMLCGPALAQTADYEVLVDLDRNAATGCSFTPSGGTLQSGYEQRLIATVDLAALEITQLQRRVCATGSFGAPQPVTGLALPVPVALNSGTGGADAVELQVDRGALGAERLDRLGLAFAADNGTGSDVLAGPEQSFPFGLPFQIPVLSAWGLGLMVLALLTVAWFAHGRLGRAGAVMAVMLVATAAWAMTFIVDGDLNDWSGVAPLAQDATGDATDGSPAIDLVAGFAGFEGGTLYFRIDVADMETQPPSAAADAYDAVRGTVDTDAVAPGPLGNDSLGVPDATLVDYGATGTRGTQPGNPYTLPGSGGVTVTVDSDGALAIDASSGTAAVGTYTFEYQIENPAGTDEAEVTIEIIDGPAARADVFTFEFSSDQGSPAGLFADNGNGTDALGTPAAAIATFGGGDLGGTVADNAAGSSVALAGGTLTVNDDGSWSLTGQPFDPGTYTFDYALENSAGSDAATVTLNIQSPPGAVDDSYEATLGETLNVPVAGGVRNANDDWTLTSTPSVFPDATVSLFGDVGSPAVAPGNPYTLTGSGGITVTLNADGSLTVDATVGSAVPGVYSLEYVLANGTTDDNATVTIDVRETPALQPDSFTIQADVDQASPASLFADNGAGTDELGTPAGTLTSFGGGDLGGTVADIPAGSSAPFAAGTLTVDDDGTWSLTGQPFDPGTHTFQYEVANAAGSDTATVTVNIESAPQAVADGFTVSLGSVDSSGSVLANDAAGVPPAAVDFYADSGDIGGASQVAAPGVYAHPTGGFTVSIDGNGAITIDASVVGVATGTYSFDYRITNAAGSSVAPVTVDIVQAPVPQPDVYAFDATADQNVGAGAGLFADNGSGVDALGTPAGTIDFFGGVDADCAAGSSVPLASGTLTVNADGSWSLVGGPFTPGAYTFDYRLTNSVGSATATVTLNIQSPPIAVDDDPGGAAAYVVSLGSSDTFPGPNGVRDRNDDYTLPNVFPDATITGYADVGDLGGASEIAPGAVYTVPGSGGVTVVLDSSGGISIDATAGTAVAGTYSFEYGLGNGTTDSSAVVTFNIDAPPVVSQSEVELDAIANSFVALPEQGAGAAPTVTSTPDLSFAFSESVTFGAGAFDVTCSSSGNVTGDYTAGATPASGVVLSYAGTGLVEGETCTATLVADAITDGQGNALDGSGDGAADGSPADDEVYDFAIDTAPALSAVEVEVGDVFTTVAGTFGGAGGVIDTDSDTTIRTTFTEPVNDNGGTTVTCTASGTIGTGGSGLVVSGNGSTQLTLSRSSGNFAGGETCTVTFNEPALTDVDAADPPDALATPSPASYQFEVAPTATDDTFTVTSHLEARFDTVAPGTTNPLSNDLPAGASIAAVNGSAANVGVQIALASGAFVTVEPDGDFNYVPAPGDGGGATDSFTYTLNAPNGSSATATVNMTIDGNVIWYVDADAAGPVYNGTAAFPFDDLAGSGNDFDANAADAIGETIFVFDSASDNSAVQCGLALLDGQVVIGEGESAGALNALTGRTPVAETVFAPDTSGAHPQLASTGNCITLAGGNTVRGLDIGNTTSGHAFVDGGATVGTATVTDVGVNGAGGILRILNGGTLNASFNETSANSAPDTEIELVSVDGSLSSAAGTITHADPASGSVSINGGNIGGTIAAEFNQTAGNSPLLWVRGGHAGALTFSAAMSASAGTGLQFDNADGTYNLQGTVSINGAQAGVNVVNGSDGTLNITSAASSIQGIQGIPFRVNNSTMAIDYDGEVFHRSPALLSARAVEIVGGTGTISLDGRVIAGDTPNPATAETVFLDNTGAANAITLNYVDAFTTNTAVFRSRTSGNVALNRMRLNCEGDLTVGGDTHCVDVSDTTSSGFTVEAIRANLNNAGDNGGALSLVNTPGVWTIEDISGGLLGRFQTTVFGNNFGTLNLATVDSGTSPGGVATGTVFSDNSTALDLENGTIDMQIGNLQSFNAATGLRVVNVGGAGLEVLDGEIPNTSGNSVVLTNADNITLNSMEISGGQANGIRGQNVTNFTLSDSLVTNHGDAISEGGLRFDNLLGVATISNTTISGSAEHNIEITNTSGALNPLTISNSLVSANSAALGGDGLFVVTQSSASAIINVSGSTFDDNQSDGIQVRASDDSSATLTVDGSTFTSTLDASPAGSTAARGIVVDASSNAALDFDIGTVVSNVFENFSPNIGEEAINVTLLSGSTPSALLSGRINNNTFTNSGGAVGIDVRGNGALVMEIDGNTATDMSRQAIDVITGDGATDIATADVTITNNSLTVTGTTANPNNEAIGWLGDFDTTSCLNVQNNTATASGTRPDFLIDDFTTAGGSVDVEGNTSLSSEANLLADNTITDAISNAGVVAAGTCVTVP